jgi:hypothetical protein
MRSLPKAAARILAVVSVLSFPPVSVARPIRPSNARQVEATEVIDSLRHRDTLTAQLRQTRQLIQKHDRARAIGRDPKARDDAEDILEMLDYAKRRQEQTLAASPTPAEVLAVNALVYRVLQSIEDPVSQKKRPPLPRVFRTAFLGKVAGHPLPRLTERGRHQPIGLRAASREPAFLYNPRTAAFFTPSQLALLSPQAIAALDVSPTHPAWLRVEALPARRAARIRQVEAEIERALTERLRDKKDLPKAVSYRCDSARRVLFLTSIDSSGTSPKAVAEDAYGIEWKLKWGDEAQVDPITTRLYLLAGARMASLVYARDPPLVILSAPNTLASLQTELHKAFGFDLLPYIATHGTVTAGNVDRLLAALPPGASQKKHAKNAIGRDWVTFRDCSVELRPKPVLRAFDGSKLSDPVAMRDRVARGSFLFNLWIGNSDVKDSNNRTWYPKRNGEITGYLEGHDDLGFALGDLMRAGEINRLPTGTRFAHVGWLGQNIRFHQPELAKPEAWRSITWPDAMWMARHIAAISEQDIRTAIAASTWPDFVQEAVAYKLIDRRNRIAELFDLTDKLDHAPATAPTVRIALSTATEIRQAEQRYALPPGSLAAELSARRTERHHPETLLEHGQIASPRRSAFIQVLEKHRYPSGLYRRYARTHD